MESLTFFDLVWRVALAAAIALTPGTLFWILVFSLLDLVDRSGQRQRLPGAAKGTA